MLQKRRSDLEISIVDAKEGNTMITSTEAEIEALDDGIKALDKSVAEATEQWKKRMRTTQCSWQVMPRQRNSLNLQRTD